MKTKKILYLLLLSCIIICCCKTATTNISSVNPIIKDTTVKSFIKLYNTFKELKLPIEFKNRDPNPYKICDTSISICDIDVMKKYFFDYQNFTETKSGLIFIGRIGRISMPANFYLFIYWKHDSPYQMHQFILATYSKTDARLISKIIVFGEAPAEYLFTSKINEDLSIDIEYLSLLNG